MDGAAGLNRPPELSLLRTPREGRAVSSSVLLALAHVPASPLPTADAQRAIVSPMTTLDPSVAAYVSSSTGGATAWDFEVVFAEGLSAERHRTVRLPDLDLTPADALTLTRTKLEALAVQRAASLEGIALESAATNARVIGGSATVRYERAATLVGMIGRTPAGTRALSEDASPTDANEGIDSSLVSRYLAVRDVGLALARALRAQVERFGPGGQIGTAQPETVQRLLRAFARWGIAPDPARRVTAPGAPPVAPDALASERLVDHALAALPQLDDRLAKAPDAAAVAQMSPVAFVDAATMLVSPTGQVAITGTIRAEAFPLVLKADGARHFDRSWLTVVAAVRKPLARLEAHQLTTAQPLVPWSNRRDDPWQTDLTDTRRLVAIYAVPGLDVAGMPAQSLAAVAALDRFGEVIPSAEQTTGAAFGFDAPAARPQQAILLAIPPDVTKPLDQETLAQILAETRELAHARMARPVDLDDSFRGLAPTALVPASGAVAIPLEKRP